MQAPLRNDGSVHQSAELAWYPNLAFDARGPNHKIPSHWRKEYGGSTA